MKVFFNGYPNHWLSPYTIIDYVFFWTDWSKCSRKKGFVDDKDFIDHPAWVEKVVPLLDPFCMALKKIREVLQPTIRYVKIDRYDTWSMDHTLAYIIHPMLLQLQKDKHGAPYTEDDDVPEYLRSHMAQPKENEWDTDSLHFMRWDWILNEMIWAFEQELKDDDENQFFDYSKSNGKTPWDKDYIGPELDTEGLKKHQERKANGFRLFGRYYQNLWD